MIQDLKSSASQEESPHPLGNDPVLETLKSLKIPVTRQNYLEFLLGANYQEPLDWEIEMTLPKQIRRKEDSEL